MKAIVHRRYGSPDVLTYEEVAMPIARDNQVLIRVRASTVNPIDWHLLRGAPGFLRLITGVSKPRATLLGIDLAGVVEAVGKKVTRFKPGDEVFGTSSRCFAECA